MGDVVSQGSSILIFFRALVCPEGWEPAILIHEAMPSFLGKDSSKMTDDFNYIKSF